MLTGVLIAIASGLIWWLSSGIVSWLAGASFLFFGAVIINGLVASRESGLSRVQSANPSLHLQGNGEFDFEVVGEASYQSALDKVAGPKTQEGVHHPCTAMIQHEPHNPHDANACAVVIDSMTVGYLPRRSAAKLVKARMVSGDKPGFTCTADALITGGWRRKGSEGNYGVSLDVKGARI